jgi:hypothetical protein
MDFQLKYLGLHVLEGSRAHDGKADKEHVRLWVRERTETVIILLSSSIPESKVNDFAINHHVSRVVVEDSWDVLAREGIGCVADKETSLSDSTITNNDAFDCLHLKGSLVE